MQLAGCIIKDKEGKILLMHRNTPQRTQWEIPGGKVEAQETPRQAAVRELAEELDVVVEVVRTVGIQAFEEDGRTHGYNWFEAKVIQRVPRLAEPDRYDKLAYFDIDQLYSMLDELSANAKNLVAAVRGKKVTL